MSVAHRLIVQEALGLPTSKDVKTCVGEWLMEPHFTNYYQKLVMNGPTFASTVLRRFTRTLAQQSLSITEGMWTSDEMKMDQQQAVHSTRYVLYSKIRLL